MPKPLLQIGVGMIIFGVGLMVACGFAYLYSRGASIDSSDFVERFRWRYWRITRYFLYIGPPILGVGTLLALIGWIVEVHH